MTAAKKCALHRSTISRWYEKFRALIAQHQEASRKPLGGPGVVVEMDESTISRIKVPIGRRKTLIWIFGMMERQKFDEMPPALVILVKDRTMSTLKPLIEKYVALGSTVYTDAFSSYSCLEELRLVHEVVFHQREWVNHRDPRIHTHKGKRIFGNV